MVATAVILTGCQTQQNRRDNDERFQQHRTDSVQIMKQLQTDPINSASVTQSTLFTHHFVTHTPTLTALAKKDLDVLAHHYIHDVMPVSTPVNIVSDVHVYFDYDKSNIRADGKPVLNEAVKALTENPDADILITGRTDVRGTDAYNEALGNRRANAVDEFMRNNGIDPSRIRILSRGEMDALSPESDEDGMQKDRNAHFVVANVHHYPVPLNVRQGGASDDLYQARKKNTLAYLAEKGVDTSLLRIADDFAGGEGLPSEQVYVIVTHETVDGGTVADGFEVGSGGSN
jgi:outer membrane protein OmpA-like peptidoglycan-associated protein